jgi:hypothetical protein
MTAGYHVCHQHADRLAITYTIQATHLPYAVQRTQQISPSG